MRSARTTPASAKSTREVADALRGEVRRIALVVSDGGHALASSGAQLSEVADELVFELSVEELEQKTHVLRSAVEYAAKLVGDMHRSTGRLETLTAVRRAQLAGEPD